MFDIMLLSKKLVYTEWDSRSKMSFSQSQSQRAKCHVVDDTMDDRDVDLDATDEFMQTQKSFVFRRKKTTNTQPKSSAVSKLYAKSSISMFDVKTPGWGQN